MAGECGEREARRLTQHTQPATALCQLNLLHPCLPGRAAAPRCLAMKQPSSQHTSPAASLAQVSTINAHTAALYTSWLPTHRPQAPSASSSSTSSSCSPAACWPWSVSGIHLGGAAQHRSLGFNRAAGAAERVQALQAAMTHPSGHSTATCRPSLWLMTARLPLVLASCSLSSEHPTAPLPPQTASTAWSMPGWVLTGTAVRCAVGQDTACDQH